MSSINRNIYPTSIALILFAVIIWPAQNPTFYFYRMVNGVLGEGGTGRLVLAVCAVLLAIFILAPINTEHRRSGWFDDGYDDDEDEDHF